MNPNQHGEPAVGVPTTVDPVDLALRRAHDAPVEPDVMRFLRKHERLVEAQMAQLGRERWRHIFIMSIGLCVLGAIIALIWEASRARGVAIEPFRVPPEMQARGLDGVVVATQVMDQLLKMQDATESLRAPSTYSNNWGDDIAVEIPNTGITIGDLRSSLRAWFGKQVRLTGELVRRVDGSVALTVRVGASPGTQFEGPEPELDTLIARAAENVYEKTQPTATPSGCVTRAAPTNHRTGCGTWYTVRTEKTGSGRSTRWRLVRAIPITPYRSWSRVCASIRLSRPFFTTWPSI